MNKIKSIVYGYQISNQSDLDLDLKVRGRANSFSLPKGKTCYIKDKARTITLEIENNPNLKLNTTMSSNGQSILVFNGKSLDSLSVAYQRHI